MTSVQRVVMRAARPMANAAVDVAASRLFEIAPVGHDRSFAISWDLSGSTPRNSSRLLEHGYYNGTLLSALTSSKLMILHSENEKGPVLSAALYDL